MAAENLPFSPPPETWNSDRYRANISAARNAIPHCHPVLPLFDSICASSLLASWFWSDAFSEMTANIGILVLLGGLVEVET